MQRILIATTLAFGFPLLAQAQQPKATYVDAAKVAAGGTFATTGDYAVQMLKRTAAGQVEVHTKETDIFYVVDGEATIVTGGTMVSFNHARADASTPGSGVGRDPRSVPAGRPAVAGYRCAAIHASICSRSIGSVTAPRPRTAS